MYAPFVTRSSKTEFTTGYGGFKILPAGSYRLGTLSIKVVSGDPRIEIASSTSLCAVAYTGFGSAVPGSDEDNTLKFRAGGMAPLEVAQKCRGDWFGAIGIAAIAEAERAGDFYRKEPDSHMARFEVVVSPNPANPVSEFRVTTTRSGPLRIALYDLQGRLARMLAHLSGTPAGTHRFSLGAGPSDPELGSGVYFYRVDALEGSVSGKMLILK
jgi:hypothetical protein